MVNKIGAQTGCFLCQSQVSSTLDNVQGNFPAWESNDREGLMRFFPHTGKEGEAGCREHLLLHAEFVGGGQIHKSPRKF